MQKQMERSGEEGAGVHGEGLFRHRRGSIDPADIAAKIERLPTLPDVAVRVMKLADDPESSPLELLRAVSADPSLAAAVLKSVNNSAFGLRRKVDTLERAIPLLGLKAVANVTMGHCVGQLFKARRLSKRHNVSDLWDHCNAVALLARRLAEPKGRDLAERAYLAGLLHDLGLLVLVERFGSQIGMLLDTAEAEARPLLALESAALGFTHQDLGMLIAQRWKLPEATCIAVGYHHDPLLAPAPGTELTALIAVADTLACQAPKGFTVTARHQTITPDLLAEAQLSTEAVDAVRDSTPEA